jgi:hypothetical protein
MHQSLLCCWQAYLRWTSPYSTLVVFVWTFSFAGSTLDSQLSDLWGEVARSKKQFVSELHDKDVEVDTVSTQLNLLTEANSLLTDANAALADQLKQLNQGDKVDFSHRCVSICFCVAFRQVICAASPHVSVLNN